MSNEIHETQTPQSPLLSPELKKLLAPIAITLALNFGGSWFVSQQSNSEVRFQTQANKEAIIANSAAIKATNDAMNQLVISMARFSESQSRIAEDLKNLQQDQRMNNSQMNRHR